MGKFLVWLVINIFSTFSFAYLFYKLSDADKKINIKIILIFALGVIVQSVIQYCESTTIRFVSYFIYFPLFFYIIKPMSLKKLVYYVLAVWFCGVGIDILTILSTSLIFYIFRVNFNIYFNYSEYVSMILTIITTILLIIISYKKCLNSFINKLYTKIVNIKNLDILLIVFAVFIFLIGVTMFFYVERLSINLLLSFVILMMSITFAVLLKLRINEYENLKYLNTLKENNEFYIKMDDENRVFKHNLMAKLLSIKSVSNKKAMVLIEDLIMQFNKSIDFSNSIKIIPYGLNGIIYQKLYPYLKELNIKINNEINYDIFNVLNSRRYNVFVEKLVVALDNAIESCMKSKTKSLVINIMDIDGCITVEVKNTFSNDINMDMLGNINYSTKGKKRGLGLFSILRNSEASVSVKIINNIFVSRITTKKRLTE